MKKKWNNFIKKNPQIDIRIELSTLQKRQELSAVEALELIPFDSSNKQLESTNANFLLVEQKSRWRAFSTTAKNMARNRMSSKKTNSKKKENEARFDIFATSGRGDITDEEKRRQI